MKYGRPWRRNSQCHAPLQRGHTKANSTHQHMRQLMSLQNSYNGDLVDALK